MGKIQWDRPEDRRFEYGVDHGVLYTEYQKGDPNQQYLENLLRASGSGYEFYYPEHTEWQDRGPDEHSQDLVAKNLYPETFFYNKLNWSTFTRYHNGWTDRKTVVNGEVVDDSSHAVSDPIDFSSGTYALWTTVVPNWCFPMTFHFYSHQTQGAGEGNMNEGYDYIRAKTVTAPDSSVMVPNGANCFRLAMPMNSMYTIDSLFIAAEITEGNTPEADMHAWIDACSITHGEEDLGTPLPEEYYKFGGKIYRGVAWNGLTGVTESPDGAEPTDLWADNMKYASMRSAETFGATIEAYQAPKEFDECDGLATPIKGLYFGQQKRKPFAFAYRTKNQTENGYVVHLIYNATASPSEKAYETINDSPDAITFSWEVTTTPLSTNGMKPTSAVSVDPCKYRKDPAVDIDQEIKDREQSSPTGNIDDPLQVLMAILFGTPQSDPFLPSPAFVERILNVVGVPGVYEGPRPIGLRQLSEIEVDVPDD